MEVHFLPETESRLQELAQQTGRSPNDLIEDAMAGYLKELGETREMLDSRYDEPQKWESESGRWGNCVRPTSAQKSGTTLSFMSEFVLHPDAVKDLCITEPSLRSQSENPCQTFPSRAEASEVNHLARSER